MMPKKCPRCEINYLMDGEKICSVCRKSVHMEDEPDEIVEMCSECGEHPAMPGSFLPQRAGAAHARGVHAGGRN